MKTLPVICLVGATGTGKSAASLAIATACNGAVVNYDSRQIYRDFPIITAQPSAEERAHCPHHLYGMLPCTEKLTAGSYAEFAGRAIATLTAQGKTPILVGGTGLYLDVLLNGIAAIPPVPESVTVHWQERCRLEGAHHMHTLLCACDPVLAAKLHPNDSQRVTRGLEVYEATGKALSWWQAQPMPPSRYRALLLGVSMDLDMLTPRLATRIDAMLDAGAIAEAETAMQTCSDPQAPGWSGIGCAELYQYLQGPLSLHACKELWLRNTRAYAKRQNTWFRRNKNTRWFAPGDVAGMADTAVGFLEGTI